MFKRIVAMLAMLVLLAGCSTVKGWFSGKEKDGEKPTKPAELVEFTSTANVTRIWAVSVGKGEGKTGVRQVPTVVDGRVYAASVEGGVSALDLQSGQRQWHYKSDLRLSGGPGAGDGLVVAGTLDGEVIALDAATGTEKWRANVPNEVISAPAVGQGLVLVRSNDGRVTAFDASTGERRWFWTNDMPSLTVRGNAPLTLGPGVVFVGNDDGTVSALLLNDGREVWQQAVGIPEGRTELQRMSDVDGAPVLDGSNLYATSFQRETVALEGPSGRPLWTRDNGGAGGVGVSSGRVLVTDPDGTVWGLDKFSGNAMWSNPQLARRLVTAPAVHGDYAAVGDYDGYVHWLKLDDGQFAARAKTGGKALKGQPVEADGILIVQNVDGELTAFRVQ